jgi:hypothetical protein
VIRFDQQNDSLRARFTSEGNAAALAQLDTLKQYTVAQADLNKITADANLIKDAAANAEARIGLAQKAGALSELGSLHAISDVRQKEVADLQTLYDNYQKIATASGNPKLLQDADNMKLALEKLRGESDLVAEKFKTIFTDSFSTAFTDFIMGTKSAGDAFKSFAQSVIQQIIKIEAQKLATSLFSDSGGSGGGGWGAAFSSIIGGLFKADGGPVNANRPYIVGERGPEMFLPSVSGSIVPNHSLGASSGNSSGDVSITINVSDNGQQGGGSGNNAELGRRIAGVVKGIIIDERRPGGLLAA